jgi:hypothetical protein
MSEYASEPFDHTSDYDPDIPEVDEFKVAQAVAAGIDEDAAREVLADEATWPKEPPFDENHHRYHTPAGPNPPCANCRYINFHQPETLEEEQDRIEAAVASAEASPFLVRDEPRDTPRLEALMKEKPYWQNEPIGDPFVVAWHDDTFSTNSEKWVSETIDMADYNYGDDVKFILAPNEHGTLVPIRIGEQERVSSDEEYPLYFAHAAIYAGNKRVGTVSYTDH